MEKGRGMQRGSCNKLQLGYGQNNFMHQVFNDQVETKPGRNVVYFSPPISLSRDGGLVCFGWLSWSYCMAV